MLALGDRLQQVIPSDTLSGGDNDPTSVCGDRLSPCTDTDDSRFRIIRSHLGQAIPRSGQATRNLDPPKASAASASAGSRPNLICSPKRESLKISPSAGRP